MAIYSPEFNVNGFELRGETEGFYSPDQFGDVLDASTRVPAQLNWLAQLLGWSGKDYWESFNSTPNQKRQLLTGSYGVYGGFSYPTVVEIRNWSNQVVIQNTLDIKENQTFFLGDYEYTPSSISKEGENLVVTFDTLSDQFLSDFSRGEQLKVILPSEIPSPFIRSNVGVSGDRSFICDVKDGAIILYPSFDTEKKLPYVFNSFYSGSRYYFNLPVKLIISDDYFIAPTYNFDTGTWYLDIPCELAEKNTNLSARLDYEGSFIIVSISIWSDPSDWVTKEKIEQFKGVWGDKGGPFPFHFTFDSLSLHGFDERKSLQLQPVIRSVGFDTLLNLVYQQQTTINSLPPPITKRSQVWWNSQTGKFSIHLDDSLNCGPWVEKPYTVNDGQDIYPDYIFPNITEFRNYPDDILPGEVVQIIDCSGMDPSDNVLGVVMLPLTSPAQAVLVRLRDSVGWVALQFIYNDVNDFSNDSLNLPANVKVVLSDSSGLNPSGVNYSVANLGITISDNYVVVLMKYELDGNWYLSPPSELRYIGDTRLFKSSLDYNNPVDGEMVWDFTNPDVNTRVASIFYYNRWEYNGILSKWELKGDWLNVNDGTLTSTPPTVVEFGSILVYCDSVLLTDGENFLTDNYQISYSINPSTGEFLFTYTPRNYEGSVSFPKVTVSDSLTTSFVSDISNIVFSGLQYYMSPNVNDSETLLRLLNYKPLFCTDDTSTYTQLNYPNALVADLNSGPLSISWERYFIRVPPSYQRNGSSWQKVNLICQDFGYWGSPSLPEDMSCPVKESLPEIYEEVFLFNRGVPPFKCIYSEPYLYSTAVPYFTVPGDYENAALLPSFDPLYDYYTEAEVVSYDPLHERRADTSSPMGRGYGEWKGDYFRAAECSFISGYLINDIEDEVLDPIDPPVWDSSIYKYPQTCILDKESGSVDANHFKVGYAFFAADLSAAEEAVFNFSPVT